MLGPSAPPGPVGLRIVGLLRLTSWTFSAVGQWPARRVFEALPDWIPSRRQSACCSSFLTFAAPSRTARWGPSDVGRGCAARSLWRGPGVFDESTTSVPRHGGRRADSLGVCQCAVLPARCSQRSPPPSTWTLDGLPDFGVSKRFPPSQAGLEASLQAGSFGPELVASPRPAVGLPLETGGRLPGPPTHAALVVPPDFSGSIRPSPCGLVASRSRSWGSRGFSAPTVIWWPVGGINPATRPAPVGLSSPTCLLPFEAFPLHAAIRYRPVIRRSPCVTLSAVLTDVGVLHPALAVCQSPPPFTVGLALSPLVPRSPGCPVTHPVKGGCGQPFDLVSATSRLCAASRSVASPACCHPGFARCSLGLLTRRPEGLQVLFSRQRPFRSNA